MSSVVDVVEGAQGETDEVEQTRTRRTVVFLVVALIVMMLMLCGLAVFYVQVVGTAQSETYEAEGSDEYTMRFEQVYYGFGKGAGEQFNRPHDVNVTPAGDMLITDSQNGRVLIMTRSGALVAQAGSGEEWGAGKLDMPNGAAAGPDGRVYVADGGARGPHGKVIIYSPDLSRIEREIFFPPQNPPITPRVFGQELYVTCAAGVKVYDLDGELLREWGGEAVGKDPEQYSFPNGILKRDDGSLVVTESNNRRVKFLDQRGTLESVIGTPPAGMRDQAETRFNLPMGIAEDENGLLYVVDAWAYRVKVLDDEGAELAALGDMGSGDGTFDSPAGLVYLGQREFLIADELNHRVIRARIDVPEELSTGERATDSLGGWVRSCVWGVPVLLIVLLAIYLVTRLRKRGARAS